MNTQLTNKRVSASYFHARNIAEKDGGRLVSHSNLDVYRMGGKPGVFWARELQVSGVPFVKGKSIKDNHTGIMLRSGDIRKAHERSRNGIYGRADGSNILLFVDAKGFSERKGFQVIEEPAIIVVENPIPPVQFESPIVEYRYWGKADEATKIALKVSDEDFERLKIDEKRWNNFRKGIWPLSRVANVSFGYYGYWCDVGGDISPSASLGVLIEGKAKA